MPPSRTVETAGVGPGGAAAVTPATPAAPTSAQRARGFGEPSGHLMAFGAVFFWSGVFVLIRYMRHDEGVGPVALYLLRFDLVALAVLLIWPFHPPRLGKLRVGQWAGLVGVAMLAAPVYQVLQMWGATGAKAGLMGMMIATTPVHVTWLGVLLLGERLRVRQSVAIVLGFTGVALPIVWDGGLGFESLKYPLALLGCAIIAAANTLYLRSMRHTASAWDVVSVMFVVAVVASQPLMGWIDVGEWTGLSARGWAAAVYLATVGQLLPMWLWAMALRRLPASTVAFYQFLMMTLAGTWGWLLRSEPMVWVDVVGIALVAGGLTLNARRPRNPRRGPSGIGPTESGVPYGLASGCDVLMMRLTGEG